MHCSTGCICAIFHLSEFSNVSSNCLPVQMQSRIGCICMLFQMSPQIVCPTRCKVEFIAFVCFSQVTFQMCPQVVCLYRCKVALVAFEQFFTWGSFQMFTQMACLIRCKVANGCIHTFFFFNCLLKLSARTDAKWHWLHLSAFSPEWVFKCVLKWTAWTEA